RRGGDGAQAHFAAMDPGTREQLEVFGHAPVEHDAPRWIRRIVEAARIADPVEALVVEGRRREVGALPVAWSDDRTAHAQLHLRGRRRQHDLDTWRWNADHASFVDLV